MLTVRGRGSAESVSTSSPSGVNVAADDTRRVRSARIGGESRAAYVSRIPAARTARTRRSEGERGTGGYRMRRAKERERESECSDTHTHVREYVCMDVMYTKGERRRNTFISRTYCTHLAHVTRIVHLRHTHR